MKVYERHPLSAVCGDMQPAEFDDFKIDILNNGVDEKIIRLLDNQILDGWHRYRAVAELEKDGQISLAIDTPHELAFVEYAGDDPISFVMTKNLQRRQLTPTQKACAVVEAFEWKPHGGAEYRRRSGSVVTKSNQEMAAAAGVGVGTVIRVKRLMRSNPEIVEFLRDGTLTAGKAVKMIQERKSVEPIISQLYEDMDFILFDIGTCWKKFGVEYRDMTELQGMVASVCHSREVEEVAEKVMAARQKNDCDLDNTDGMSLEGFRAIWKEVDVFNQKFLRRIDYELRKSDTCLLHELHSRVLKNCIKPLVDRCRYFPADFETVYQVGSRVFQWWNWKYFSFRIEGRSVFDDCDEDEKEHRARCYLLFDPYLFLVNMTLMRIIGSKLQS